LWARLGRGKDGRLKKRKSAEEKSSHDSGVGEEMGLCCRNSVSHEGYAFREYAGRKERRNPDRLLNRLLRGMIVIFYNRHLRFATKPSHDVLSMRFVEGK
jgi:hypothetical protein